ncbi:MAG: hypothetical protein IJ475_03650 [Bacilli bacterium]|nr:hypothetical protein [Bacilli bacterium]
MARVVVTDKVKKKKRIRNILLILAIIVLLAIISLVVYNVFFKEEPKTKVEIKILDSLDDYGYTLSDNDTELFKTEYEAMKQNLNSDAYSEEEYAKSIAKLFVIDLYTMTNKVNKYDIGGLEYYYGDKKTMYETKVMDTLYSSLIDNTYGDRKQQLPEVKTIEVSSIEKTTYSLGKEKVEGYLVKLNWTYVQDLKYDDKGSIVLCKEGIRWSIVDYQPTLNPKYN